MMICVALGAMMLPAPGAQAYMFKRIRDWGVSCTTGLVCTMDFGDWTVKGINKIAFRRKGTPDAKIQVLFSLPEGFDQATDMQATYTVTVDGVELLSLRASALLKDTLTETLVYEDVRNMRLLLDAMKAGTSMDVRYSGALGNFTLPVSLAGVKGSLLYIDEAQDRLGQVDALEAKGDKPAKAQIKIDDITNFDDLPEIVRKDFTLSGAPCQDFDTSSMGNINGIDAEIDGSRIIAVPCGGGGAYNQPFALYLGYDVIIERTSFPDWDGDRPISQGTVYNLDFHPLDRTFTSFFKGRGIGDCGSWFKWKLVQNATSLALVEARRKDDCDENDMGGPENFPLVFPVKK